MTKDLSTILSLRKIEMFRQKKLAQHDNNVNRLNRLFTEIIVNIILERKIK